jgi:hypothetical protein
MRRLGSVRRGGRAPGSDEAWCCVGSPGTPCRATVANPGTGLKAESRPIDGGIRMRGTGCRRPRFASRPPTPPPRRHPRIRRPRPPPSRPLDRGGCGMSGVGKRGPHPTIDLFSKIRDRTLFQRRTLPGVSFPDLAEPRLDSQALPHAPNPVAETLLTPPVRKSSVDPAPGGCARGGQSTRAAGLPGASQP